MRSLKIVSGVVPVLLLLAGPSFAQQGSPTPAPATPAASAQPAASVAPAPSLGNRLGYRASKLVGSDVLDPAGATIGKIDDIIIRPAETSPDVVLSVGTGSGAHLVLVRYEDLLVANNKITLTGVAKDSLSALPNFSYSP